jgi:ketosteroid isomerase-like protein
LSFKNKKLVKKINEAFAKGNFTFISEHLEDNIKWKIVGMPEIIGRDEFMNSVKMLELENFLNHTEKNIIAEGDYVVVESSANKNSKTKVFTPSFCDIYRIKDEKIIELTTYIVDIT